MSTGTAIAPAGRNMLSVVGVVATRDVLRQLGRPGNLVAQGMQMLFFLLVYSIGFNQMIDSVDGLAFRAYVFPGIVAIHIVSMGINAGMTFAWDRMFGLMREMLIAPVPRWTVVAGKIVGTAVVAVCHSVVLIALAPIVGVAVTPSSCLAAVAVCAVGAAVFCSFGLLLASSTRRIETLQNVVQLALYPMLFLSGSVFRPDQLPHWLEALVRLNPMTYVVDLLRHAFLAPVEAPFPAVASVWVNLLFIGLFCAVGMIGSCWRVGR